MDKMKNVKSIFVETIFEILVATVIFGFGFYVLNVGLFFNEWVLTILFAIILILVLFVLNLLKENFKSNFPN